MYELHIPFQLNKLVHQYGIFLSLYINLKSFKSFLQSILKGKPQILYIHIRPTKLFFAICI